jgi:serine/threonine protein kinase
MTPNADDLIGHIINGYQIEQVLGTGGAGTVYLAHSTDPAQPQVAIKVLMPPTMNVQEQTEFRKRFIREADMLTRLHHPHILPVQALGEDEASGIVYMVMPYIQGGTLADRLMHGPLSLQQAMNYLNQLADALEYSHSNQVIHRDLKPANVLIDEHDHVYLADFGIAKLLDQSVVTMTNVNQIIGTPGYMAPEQIASEPVSPATDVYCLGILAYEMFTGKMPFDAPSLVGLLRQIALEEPVSPRDLCPTLPRPADEVILRALAKVPEQRFPSAQAFARALERGLQGKQMTPLPQSLIAYSREMNERATQPDAVPASWIADSRQQRQKRRHLFIAACLASAFLLGIVCTIFAYSHVSQHAIMTVASHTVTPSATMSSTVTDEPTPALSATDGPTPAISATNGSTPLPVKNSTPTPPATNAPPTPTHIVGTPTDTPVPGNLTVVGGASSTFNSNQYYSYCNNLTGGYTLTNTGGQSVSWSSNTRSSNSSDSISYSPVSGGLAPGGTESIQITGGFLVSGTSIEIDFNYSSGGSQRSTSTLVSC